MIPLNLRQHNLKRTLFSKLFSKVILSYPCDTHNITLQIRQNVIRELTEIHRASKLGLIELIIPNINPFDF